MKRNMFLSGVAALALMGGITAAMAQQNGMSGNSGGMSDGTSGGATTHRSESGGMQPGSNAAPSMGQNSPRAGSGASDTNNRSAQEHQGSEPNSTVGQNGSQTGAGSSGSPNNRSAQEHQGSEPNSTVGQNGSHTGPGSSDSTNNRSAQEHQGTETGPAMGQNGSRTGANPSDTNNRNAANGQNERNGANNPQTQRSVATSGAPNLSEQERTRVRSETSHVNIREATNIDVNVSVGVAVPRTITEYWEPVPTDIVAIVPAWRAYRIVKIHDRLIIVDPDTFKIIYVIEG